jgi:low temperature requirement protein LtrA
MSLFVRRFRDWWQIPRKVGNRWEHRQVSFLELFYDLVYVVLIAQFSHSLAHHISLEALGEFAFLFIIVWWAWFNGTTYHDIHGNNDIRTRVFTFLQMFSVVAMAIFSHDPLGETSVGFALSYAVFQLILTYLWWRTGVHDPKHRPLSRPYSATFLLNSVLFVISVFLPAPTRFYLWGIALLLSLLLPFILLIVGRKDPAAQAELEIATPASPSLVERFGLFNIIVLGEIIVGVVAGTGEHHHLTWEIGKSVGLGTLIAICVWWAYFDYISHRLPRPGTSWVGAWYYLHLPLTANITVIGAAILSLVEHAGEHPPEDANLLLISAVAVVLLSIAALAQTVQFPEEFALSRRWGSIALVISAVFAVGLSFLHINTILLMVLLVASILFPIFIGFLTWLKSIDNIDSET